MAANLDKFGHFRNKRRRKEIIALLYNANITEYELKGLVHIRSDALVYFILR